MAKYFTLIVVGLVFASISVLGIRIKTKVNVKVKPTIKIPSRVGVGGGSKPTVYVIPGPTYVQSYPPPPRPPPRIIPNYFPPIHIQPYLRPSSPITKSKQY